MQVSVEAGEGLERKLTIQVPAETVEMEVNYRLNSIKNTEDLSFHIRLCSERKKSAISKLLTRKQSLLRKPLWVTSAILRT